MTIRMKNAHGAVRNMVSGLAFMVASTLLAAAPLQAEITVPPEDRIDAVISSVMQENGGTGTAIAVLYKGEPVFVKGYGTANLEHGIPVTEETVFQSGSVGKMFTAAAIMLLVEEGKLSLDDKLSGFFPGVSVAWEDISIRHMLSHRGGFARLYGPETAIWPLYGPMTDEEFVEKAGIPDLIFTPGTKYTESNGAYVLLGIIIKKLTGQFYGDYLEKALFKPLGMKKARVNEPRAVLENRAQGYVFQADSNMHAHYVGEYFSKTADGSLVFTIEDMIAWERGLYTGSFLRRENLSEIFKAAPYPDGSTGVRKYGFGWDGYDIRGHQAWEHSGYWQGFSTYVVRYPEDDLAITVLTNSQAGQPKHIAAEVAGLINQDLGPYAPLPDQSSAGEMRQLTLSYLAGKLDGGRFNPAASGSITGSQIARVQSEVTMAPSSDFELVERRSEGQNLIYTYRFTGEMGRESAPVYFVTYRIGANGKVSAVTFQLGR